LTNVPKGLRKTTRQQSGVADRVTLVVRAENRGDVLARVVMLFHRLNFDIEALCMVRAPQAETMRIDVTVQADRERARRIESSLYKVVDVRSVETERSKSESLGGALSDKLALRTFGGE
jgi:acetolactate synthase small subunit